MRASYFMTGKWVSRVDPDAAGTPAIAWGEEGEWRGGEGGEGMSVFDFEC